MSTHPRTPRPEEPITGGPPRGRFTLSPVLKSCPVNRTRELLRLSLRRPYRRQRDSAALPHRHYLLAMFLVAAGALRMKTTNIAPVSVVLHPLLTPIVVLHPAPG